MPTALERINEQETQPGAVGVLATITQSGCTNTCGYNIEIHNDGSATGVTIGTINSLVTKQDFPPGTIDTKDLQNLLTEIGDVSKIPTGACMKSASFGTRTQITYAGKTSGDLQCQGQPASGGDQAPMQASEDLRRFVRTTLSQLKINDRRVSLAP